MRIPLKTVLIGSGGLVALWLSIGVTTTLVLGKRMPEAAQALWPYGVTPKLTVANTLLSREPDAAQVRQAAELAAASLRREPGNAEAARTLALARAGENDYPAAGRLFHYAEKLSRRDLPTHLWLIEESVQKNDIPGALRHYDRALRTSRAAAALLLPTLATAAEDQAIARPLLAMLEQRPPWWQDFLTVSLKQTGSLETLTAVAKSVRLDLAEPAERLLAIAVMNRLIAKSAHRLAYDFHRSVTSAQDANRLIRNGSFERADSFHPFDWWLNDGTDLSASREARADGRGIRLLLQSRNGQGGRVAEQMLLLPPGAYRFQGIAADVDRSIEARPSVRLSCVGGPVIAEERFVEAGNDPAAFSFTFTVPTGKCGAQRLVLNVAPLADTNAWLDDVQITSLTR